MDPFIEKIQQRLINGKYHLVKKIGGGGQGVVFLGKDAATDEEVALKFEHRENFPSLLACEYNSYENFGSVFGFPRVDWLGVQDDFRVMILELLGPSLEDLLTYCEGHFSLKTTLLLADQLLQRLNEIHSRGYLHRDIKPSNFLLGTGCHGNVVYVTDFGLMQEISSHISKPVINIKRRLIIGSPMYASIQGHLGATQSPKDDLESLCYVLVHFMKGKLPWLRYRGNDDLKLDQRILDKKIETSAEKLCADLPWAFAECMRHAKSLKFGDIPNYEKLQAMFRSLAAGEGILYDNIFDWTERFILQERL